MPFQKGHTLSKGRPRGALNRSSEQAKLAVARLANQGIEALREDMEIIRKTNPEAAAKLYIRLIEFIVPKKSSIDLKAEVDARIQQITVNINTTDTQIP